MVKDEWDSETIADEPLDLLYVTYDTGQITVEKMVKRGLTLHSGSTSIILLWQPFDKLPSDMSRIGRERIEIRFPSFAIIGAMFHASQERGCFFILVACRHYLDRLRAGPFIATTCCGKVEFNGGTNQESNGCRLEVGHTAHRGFQKEQKWCYVNVVTQ